MDALGRDLHFAIRSLRRRPAFAALCIATLAIGIGATTAIFGVVDRALLRPLPFREAGALLRVHRTLPSWRERDVLRGMWNRVGFSYPGWRDWQRQQSAFASIGAWSNGQAVLSGPEGAEQVRLVRSSASLAGVLGTTPLIGRFIAPGEDVPPGARVAVLDHATWQTRFGATPDVVGRPVALDGDTYEIVGVLPPEARLPGTDGATIWIPGGGAPSDLRPGATEWYVVGRLAAGTTTRQAEDEVARLTAAPDGSGQSGARLVRWHDEVTRTMRRPLLLLLGASAILLLLASVNVATLFVGAVLGRIGEFATRRALGAGRGHLMRQLLGEALILAAVGLLVGIGIAVGGTRLLLALAPAPLSRLAGTAVDARVLAFAAAIGVIAAVAAALGPMMVLNRLSVSALMRGGSFRATMRHSGALSRALLAVQLPLSLVLLVGAGLLGRSLHRLTSISPGFPPARLLVVGLGATGQRWASPESQRALFEDVAGRVGAIPGIERVAIGSAVPFSGGNSSSEMEVEDPGVPGTLRSLNLGRSHVMPGFSETLGLRLVAGRTIADRDAEGAPPVVVVNETAARLLWPGGNPLGQRIRFDDTWHEVIGVVGDTRHRTLADDNSSRVYFAERQHHTPYLMLVARIRCAAGGRCEAATFAPAVRRAVAEVAPSVPVTRVETMEGLVRNSTAAERFRSTLVGVFAVVALLLAVTGVFGVAARAVRQERRVIAIRLALGSTPGRVALTHARPVAVVVAVGALTGVVASFAVARLLAPLLFGISATDPLTFMLASGSLVSLALAASLLPIARASRMNLSHLLREQ